MGKYLPLEPLARLVRRLYPDLRIRDTHKKEYETTTYFFSEILGISSKSWYRWEERGYLSEKYADVLSCRLGTHPYLLWGEEWLQCAGGELEELMEEAV